MRTLIFASVSIIFCLAPAPAFSVTYNVAADGSGDYPTIQDAINATVSGDTILLGDGTFTGSGNWDLDFGGRNIVVRSENGKQYSTIYCGNGSSGEHRAFHFHSGEASTAIVELLTIADGHVETMDGGGILIENGSAPTIRNCFINSCRVVGNPPSDGVGGGIAIFDSAPRIIDNTIYSNIAIVGGGIFLNNSTAVIMGNDIYDNTADSGAGIQSFESVPVIVNNWINANHGGGVVLLNYSVSTEMAVINNNLFDNNMDAAALIWSAGYGFAPSITSCTFFANSVGGVYLNGNGSIMNCIFHNNGTTEIDAYAASVTYCWVEGGYPGTGNINGTTIPWDVGIYGEVYLPTGSECLDAGSGPAAGICFDTQYGLRCMNQLSALQSERPDTGQVDLGYHYIRRRTTLYVPGDADEIQAAIEAAVDGDRIEVTGDPLTMYGPIDFLGKAVHVIAPSGRRRISGGNSQTAVTFMNHETSSSILENFDIYYGSAWDGGGIRVGYGSPRIIGCAVYDCVAEGGDGGGVWTGSTASPRFESFLISGCQGRNGGGVFTMGPAEFVDGLITGCESSLGGGAFVNNSDAVFSGVEFHQNHATGTASYGGRGGGIYVDNLHTTLEYCSFTGNTTQEYEGESRGGGIYLTMSFSEPIIHHCVVAGNTAISGAGIFAVMNSGAEVSISNSIVAFNVGGEGVYCSAGGAVNFSCSDIYQNDGGDWIGCVEGQEASDNNFRADPVFRDLLGGMTTVAGTSPCAATNNPSCGWIGAYTHSHPLNTWTLNQGGSGDFGTIQSAVSSGSVAGGDTIILENGVYTGIGNVDVNLLGKSLIIKSGSLDPEQCVIDCQGSSGNQHRGFFLKNREGNATRIEGITIRNGWTGGAGGGINMTRSEAMIKDCVFEKCHAFDGGGIISSNCGGLIWGCGFDSCTADDAGGGMIVSLGNPTLRDCRFIENWANWGGGGLYNNEAAPYVERCVFAGNSSDHWGGGVHNNRAESVPVLQNCTFSRNSAPLGGGMFSRNFAAPVVYNSIIAFSLDGVAVHTQTDATTTLYCSDVYGNDDGDYVGGILGQDGANGNFSADPLFCDELIHYLRLADASPCTQGNSGGCGLIGAIWENCSPTTDAGVEETPPAATRLYACYPNPFNPFTVITFDLSAPVHVDLRIYDVAGRLIRVLIDEDRRPGRFKESWNGKNDSGGKVASGVYFYRLSAGDYRGTMKMVLLR